MDKTKKSGGWIQAQIASFKKDLDTTINPIYYVIGFIALSSYLFGKFHTSENWSAIMFWMASYLLATILIEVVDSTDKRKSQIIKIANLDWCVEYGNF